MITKQTQLNDVLKLGMPCNNDQGKCRLCCAYNSGILLEQELQRIAEFLNISVGELKEKYLQEKIIFNTKAYLINTINEAGKPYGSCLFFEKTEAGQNCRIHDVKPLHCKLANCNEHGEALHQWFVLNYVVDVEDPDSLRAWHAYTQTTKVIQGGYLEELVPDAKERSKILSNEALGKSKQELKRFSDELIAHSSEVEKNIQKRRDEFIKKLNESGFNEKLAKELNKKDKDLDGDADAD